MCAVLVPMTERCPTCKRFYLISLKMSPVQLYGDMCCSGCSLFPSACTCRHRLNTPEEDDAEMIKRVAKFYR